MVAISDFRATQYPVVDGLRCVQVWVPDDDAFMPLLAGLLYLPTRAFNYTGDTFEKRGQLGEMWVNAYDKNEWIACMRCEDVAACINDDAGTQDAIANAITNNINIQNAIANTFNPNTVNTQSTAEYRKQNQMSDEVGCDNDVAWGRIRDGLVERSFQRVTDVLEEIELTTDNQEMLAKTLDAIPGLGEALQVIGVAAWISWFDNVRAFLADAFAAGDTLEKRDQIACDLFCIWQRNCTLSFENISQYFFRNAKREFPSWTNAYDSFNTLITAMADPTELTGDFVVDVLLASEFGFQSFINQWFGARIGTCGDDLLFGAANAGWETACETCPDPCIAPEFYTVNPVGFSGGTFDVTDNMDGTWTVVGTSAADSGANRLAFADVNGCCWNVISAEYSGTPENLNAVYGCGAAPTDMDYGNGVVDTPATPGNCIGGIIAASVTIAFTVTVVLEACPV